MELKEGIIVKTSKYLENSKIVYIVSEEGMFSCISRASNKMTGKNYSYSQNFTKIKFAISKSKRNSFDTLTSGIVLDNYLTIKNDFDKLSAAMSIFDVTYNLSNHIDDYKTFYVFFSEILDKITTSNYHNYYLIVFRLKMLYLLGIGPSFSKCVNCANKENLVYFDFYHGGMICNNCISESQKKYSGIVVEVMKLLYIMKLDSLSDEVFSKLPDCIEEISDFLDDYYEAFIGYKSISKKVLSKVNKIVKK